MAGSLGPRLGRAAESRAARGGSLVSSGNGQRARKGARPWPPLIAFGGIDMGGRAGAAGHSVVFLLCPTNRQRPSWSMIFYISQELP
jgi:hypothetical protein